MSELKKINERKCFGGIVEFYEHSSEACRCPMRFSLYLPSQSEQEKLPVVYWLSGLECNEENFMAKSGAQRYADELGLILVAPDTSPRGCGIEGEDDSWDFGTGAGFYVNATQAPWSENYRMYEYVSSELIQIIEDNFPAKPGFRGISGHSMGGHGAMIVALKNPGKYQSVSAFAPICAPSLCPWGKKAFGNYLGEDSSQWAEYDANELVKTSSEKLPILIDQGTGDTFLKKQLLGKVFEKTCQEVGYPLDYRWQEGYGHSYYFVSSFIGEHLQYHAKALHG